ncbi:MAG: class I SAM-dependent methyltransferase [bacterium]
MANFDKIADTYDLMVNWPARLTREMPFFEKIINNNQVKSILDIGCATGNHARAFAQHGVSVIAVDPSEEMLKIATNLTDGSNPTFTFGGLGMALPNGKYDIITILGNTATLVESMDKFKESIKDLHEKLTKNGVLIIQIVNYDKIIKQQILSLPAMKQKRNDTEYIFLREYRMVEKSPELTVITIKLNNDDIKHRIEHTKHLPLTSEKLAKILRQSGFAKYSFYADYSNNPFNSDESGSLIAVAEK